MYISSLVKIHCHLLKLSSGRKNMAMWWADNSVKKLNLPNSNPKPDLHNINAHTKFGENSLMFTHVNIRKRNMDRRKDDGHTDIQPETIIPHYFSVVGYKNITLWHFLFKNTKNGPRKCLNFIQFSK